MQDGKCITTKAVPCRLNHRQRNGSGHGRINGMPPCSSIRNPACEASGCEVAIMLGAMIGMRCEG